MGVIKKEGIKQSIVSYIGVLIGIVNVVYFYPKFLTEEELGLYRFLIDTATLLFPFISLGVHNLSVRMFPIFKDPENGHHGLWFFLLSGIVVGYIFFLSVIVLFFPFIDQFFADETPLIQQNWRFIIPLSGLVILVMICTQYILNFKKILVTSIINDLFIKVGLPVIAGLVYFDICTLQEGVYVLIGVYAAAVLTLMLYIVYLKQWHFKPDWNFLKKPLLKEMGTYSFYGILGSLGSILVTRIDVFMIAVLADNSLQGVGVYSIAMIMANVIMIPARSINNISSPVIAEAWKTFDIDSIKTVYSKSSIVLLTVGVLFLVGIWSSVDDIFRLMPNGERFAVGKYVILILGLAKLFDLATGTNGQVIAYSKFFRFNFYAVLILAVFNVICNFIFIPIYQINGAALASASSIFIFNISKTAFVHYKMGLQPFSLNTLKVLVIGAIVYVTGLFIPSTDLPFLDIIFRSAYISITFVSAILYFNISEDVTNLFWQGVAKIKAILKF